MKIRDVEAPMLYVAHDNPSWALFVLDIVKYPEPNAHFSGGYAQVTWKWVRHPDLNKSQDVDQVRTSQFSLNENFNYYADVYEITELLP